MSVTQISLQEYLDGVSQGLYTESEFRELQESSLHMNTLAGDYCRPKEAAAWRSGQLRTPQRSSKSRLLRLVSRNMANSSFA
jgi:hypothetical protein